MIYAFACDECCNEIAIPSRPFHPPSAPACCGVVMRRVYGCYIDTSSCRDADDIPAGKRVVRSGIVRGAGDVSPQIEERKFARHIENRRKDLLSNGNKGSSFRHTHSVPADLYHGKIRETGDKNYWNDSRNLSKHNSCKVS